MTDRVSVSLTVLTTQFEKVKKLIADASWHVINIDHATIFFEEVYNGELEFLPEFVQAGIAYESEWDEGGEFEAGIEICRFTSAGEAVLKSINDSDWAIPITKLVCLLDKPDELRKLITDQVHENDYLPWENQEEYGKLYMANQLINPSQS